MGYLGRPAATTHGGCLLGSFGDRPAHWVDSADGAVTVADARLHAWLDRPAPAAGDLRLAEPAPVLDRVLRHAGSKGLELLAGDFAVARWEPLVARLTLARDPFGLRPLFWARRGQRFAFAPDVEVLVLLGVASGMLDHRTIARFLSSFDWGGERTAFDGVSRVLGGHALVVDRDGDVSSRRWFEPEQIPTNADLDPREHALAVRDAVISSLEDRLAERPGLLSLSGGRDSGALAVATAEAGYCVDCATFDFADVVDTPADQLQLDALAGRDLAHQLGLRWHGLRVSERVLAAELRRLGSVTRTPVVGLHFSLLLALHDQVLATPGCVVIDGEGGDLLFATHPIVVLDLLRSGAFKRARRAVHGYHHDDRHRPYRALARTAGRGLIPWATPAPVQRWRTREDVVLPPWVLAPESEFHEQPPILNARQEMVDGLLERARDPLAETSQIVARVAGAEYAAPLLDQRVVRAALSGPATGHAPDPGLKPILRQGLLREHDRSRRKGDFSGYYARVARACVRDCEPYTRSAKFSAQAGFIRVDRLSELENPRWQLYGVPLAEVEAWLSASVATDDAIC